MKNHMQEILNKYGLEIENDQSIYKSKENLLRMLKWIVKNDTVQMYGMLRILIVNDLLALHGIIIS